MTKSYQVINESNGDVIEMPLRNFINQFDFTDEEVDQIAALHLGQTYSPDEKFTITRTA